jgi:creatinine amidohydrolase/Fe(II)-dependent formamide hydrolase-like protein
VAIFSRSTAGKAKAEGRTQEVHVYFCDEVYAKAQGDYEKMLQSRGLPTSAHAGIQDTSELMYLQGSTQDYTRLDLLPVAVTVPGTTGELGGAQPSDATMPRPVPSGVRGDGRKSTVELGKMAFDNKVDYAVRQIRQLLVSGVRVFELPDRGDARQAVPDPDGGGRRVILQRGLENPELYAPSPDDVSTFLQKA